MIKHFFYIASRHLRAWYVRVDFLLAILTDQLCKNSILCLWFAHGTEWLAQELKLLVDEETHLDFKSHKS